MTYVLDTNIFIAALNGNTGVILLGRFQEMSNPDPKTFDCVQSMRQIRDRISAEIAEMSYDELAQWLRAQQYSDPVLQRLAERAVQQAEVARLSRSRTA